MTNISTNLNKSSTISQFLKVFEPAFTVVSLFIFSKGILAVLISKGSSQGDGSSMANYNYAPISFSLIIIYLITFLLLTFRWRKVLAVLIRDRYICFYLGIFVLSYFWSYSPQDTLKPSISGIGATAFGLYLATRYTLKEQVKLLFWTFAAMLITSILFAVAIPKYAFMAGVHEGAFRGIFSHKNTFGPIMVLGVLIFLIRTFDRSKNYTWLSWLYVAISMVLIVLSKSGNALLLLLIMLPLFFISRILRSRYEIMISAFLTFAIVGLMVIHWFNNNQEVFFAAIGEDATLTGRTEIWQYVWDMIQQRPWLGYGYEGFWHNLDGPSAYVMLARGSIGPNGLPHAHNGFLEMMLATGIVGLSIFLIGFAINFFKAIVLIRTSRDMETFWPLLYLTYVILGSIAETPLSSLNSIEWVLYSAAIFSLTIPQSQFLEENKSYIAT